MKTNNLKQGLEEQHSNSLNVNISDLRMFVKEEITKQIKDLFEKLMIEERNIYLEENSDDIANGFYTRDLLTSMSELKDLKVPRTRSSKFKSALIPYRKRVSYDLKDIIFAMVITGSSMRDVSHFIEKAYGAKYRFQSISRLTKVAKEEIESWRKRKLEEEYTVIFFDSLFVSLKRKDVQKEPVYLLLGITKDGRREIIGYYIFGSEGESIECWRMVFEDLYIRGVRKVGVFVSDNVNNQIVEVVQEIYPDSKHQLCIVHLLRRIEQCVRERDKKEVLEDCKRIYRSETKEEAYRELEKLKIKWQNLYPKVIKMWESRLENYLAFLDFPKEVRKYIYTTNLLERENKEFRRRIKVIEVFTNESSLEKYFYFVSLERNEKLRNRRLKNFNKFFDEEGKHT